MNEEPMEPSAWAMRAAEELLAIRIVRKSQAAMIIERALLESEDEIWEQVNASMDITEGGLNDANLYKFYYSKFLMMRDAYRRLMVRYKKLEAYYERKRRKTDDADG